MAYSITFQIIMSIWTVCNSVDKFANVLTKLSKCPCWALNESSV